MWSGHNMVDIILILFLNQNYMLKHIHSQITIKATSLRSSFVVALQYLQNWQRSTHIAGQKSMFYS